MGCKVYVIVVGVDVLFADVVFDYVGASEFGVDADGVSAVDPYSDELYKPSDGDLIIDVHGEDDTEMRVGLMRGMGLDGAKEVYDMLSRSFKRVYLYVLNVGDDFNPFLWERYKKRLLLSEDKDE